MMVMVVIMVPWLNQWTFTGGSGVDDDDDDSRGTVSF